MVQPPFVRTERELALHRRRAIKGHAAREAKRTENAAREANRFNETRSWPEDVHSVGSTL
jgi:hypothetical protein